MDESFPHWLNQQIRDRGWSQAEFARRSEISTSHVSRVIAGTHDAGLEFYQAAARTFHVPLEEVFRLAGILPPAPPESGTGGEALLRRLNRLPAADRDFVLRSWLAAVELAESRQTR